MCAAPSWALGRRQWRPQQAEAQRASGAEKAVQAERAAREDGGCARSSPCSGRPRGRRDLSAASWGAHRNQRADPRESIPDRGPDKREGGAGLQGVSVLGTGWERERGGHRVRGEGWAGGHVLQRPVGLWRLDFICSPCQILWRGRHDRGTVWWTVWGEHWLGRRGPEFRLSLSLVTNPHVSPTFSGAQSFHPHHQGASVELNAGSRISWISRSQKGIHSLFEGRDNTVADSCWSLVASGFMSGAGCCRTCFEAVFANSAVKIALS